MHRPLNREEVMSDGQEEISLARQIARYVVLGVILMVLGTIVTYLGVNDLMSKNCRSKNNPAVYGQQYCVPPQRASPTRKSGTNHIPLIPPIPSPRVLKSIIDSSLVCGCLEFPDRRKI